MRSDTEGTTFEDALHAWRAGDADGTLRLCERIVANDPATSAEVTLLRTRALLRLRLVADALALLEERFVATGELDGSLTARMLLGTAYTQRGEAERGLAILEAAAADAEEAEPMLRSEIALGIALAWYGRGEFVRAEAALGRVDPRADIIHARALECRGWIAKLQGEFVAANAWFDAALERLESCRQRNRVLEANLLMIVGNLAVELLDFERWLAIEQRARRGLWEPHGINYHRFWMEMNRSMAGEIEGRPRDALQAARNAITHAPSAAFRLFAHCRRAAVLFAYGELLGYEDLAASIRGEFASIDVRELHHFEEINLPAAVAETLALIGDGPGAQAALGRMNAMSAEQVALLGDEPMKRAFLEFVRGLVADANSDAFSARHRYRSAFRAFDELGMTRRALIAALRLSELSGEPDVVRYVEAHVRHLPAGSWIRARAARSAAWRADRVLAELTRADREVLALLCDGKSTAEIAELRDRSPQTIRNAVSRLLKTFALPNRQALIKECLTRGLVPDACAAPTRPLP